MVKKARAGLRRSRAGIVPHAGDGSEVEPVGTPAPLPFDGSPGGCERQSEWTARFARDELPDATPASLWDARARDPIHCERCQPNRPWESRR